MNVVKFCLLPVLAILAIAFAAGFVWTGTLPEAWEAEETREIDAPKEAIHAWVADQRNWVEWDEFRHQNPDVPVRYEDSGRRAIYSTEKGEVVNEIVESDPDGGITMHSSIGDQSPAVTEIDYETRNGATLVRYRIHGTASGRAERLLGWLMTSVYPEILTKNLDRLEGLVESGATPDHGARTPEPDAEASSDSNGPEGSGD